MSENKIIRISENEVDEIISLIKSDFIKNIYFYVDLIKYRTSNSNVKFFKILNHDGEIEVLLMQFFTGLQLFPIKKITTKTVNLIEEYIENEIEITQVIGIDEIIKNIKVDESKFYYDETRVIEHPIYDFKMKKPDGIVKKVAINQLDEIIEFMKLDTFYGDYSKEKLYAELEDRLKTNYGNIYEIKVDGEIVAIHQTAAETDEIACMGLLLVKPELRLKGYSLLLLEYITKEKIEEGKRVFSFLRSPTALPFYVNNGAVHLNMMSKYIKKLS